MSPLSLLGWILLALLKRLAGPVPEIDEEALAEAVRDVAALYGVGPPAGAP